MSIDPTIGDGSSSFVAPAVVDSLDDAEVARIAALEAELDAAALAVAHAVNEVADEVEVCDGTALRYEDAGDRFAVMPAEAWAQIEEARNAWKKTTQKVMAALAASPAENPHEASPAQPPHEAPSTGETAPLNACRLREEPSRAMEGHERDAWLAGFATALAEMHRGLIFAGRDPHLGSVARQAGLTLAEARRIGVHPLDLEHLQRAGVS